jgi:hypothetical protein
MSITVDQVTELAKLVTPLLLVVLAIQQQWAKSAAEKVAKTLVDSDHVINGKVDNLTVQTDKVHTLVNSNMGLQLGISAALARRIADLTGLESDASIAEAHEKLSHDHEAKQAQVDKKEEQTFSN